MSQVTQTGDPRESAGVDPGGIDVPQTQAQAGKAGVTVATPSSGARKELAEVLIDLGFLTEEQLVSATERAAELGVRPEQLLMDENVLNGDQLARAVAQRFGLNHLDLKKFTVDIDAAKLVTPAAVKRYQAVPVGFLQDRTLLVAMANPANVIAIDDIAVMTGYEVRPGVASPDDIAALQQRIQDGTQTDFESSEEDLGPQVILDHKPAGPLYDLSDTSNTVSGGNESSVIGLVQRIIDEAVQRGTSDIHFEPTAEGLRVRYRIDGVLCEAAVVPQEIVGAITSRIKILSDLDIAERRIPQDGRVGMEINDRHIDIRVATLPTQHGENVVMRILDHSSVLIEMEQLGMLPQALERFTTAFSQSHGAVLVTGPTGSGKTTTLYAALNRLNTIDRNIITIEDPVEYQLDGITQTQVNPKAGLKFSTGLRAMMRADPDVIMVGEIRDRETAQTAIEAALTGHLVLSTLHTNDAPAAVTRLIEMGIEPFLVGSAIDCVVAQRLARVLCGECKRQVTLPAEVLRANGFNVGLDLECFEPVGCPKCAGSGYKGRVGLYEVMRVSETIRSLAVGRETADAIANVAVHEGMVRLREDGIQKVRAGITSIAEIARVASSSR